MLGLGAETSSQNKAHKLAQDMLARGPVGPGDPLVNLDWLLVREPGSSAASGHFLVNLNNIPEMKPTKHTIY